MNIMNISCSEIANFWKSHLWTDTKIRLSSSIIFNTYPFEYDLNYHNGERIFLGAFCSHNVLVGVNSLHRTDEVWRSRGLCVLPSHRGKGISQKLLKETIDKAEGKCWSIPKRTALSTYLRSGFVQTSDFFETETSKENCYVEINKTKEHLEQQ